jgi:4-amino-4-deoxy-L-arabinose transferase-like glycosyltransferase
MAESPFRHEFNFHDTVRLIHAGPLAVWAGGLRLRRMRHRLMKWLLILVITGPLCVYVLGNGAVGLFDRDEPRYAQTSRQMLASGDWVVPRFLDKVRTAKPVLIYWCQASAMSVLGDNRFAARLPSALAMAGTVALLAMAVSRAAGRRRGLWTAFILGSCTMAIISAKMCLTDAVLLLFITTSQLCLYRLWRCGPDPVTVGILGLAIGLAGLTKGPVALGVNTTTLLTLWLLRFTWKRSASRATGLDILSGQSTVLEYENALALSEPARPPFRNWHWPIVILSVLAIVALVAGPWLYLIQHRAPEFLTTAINRDVVDRMQRGQEGHSAPPGTYLMLVWGTFFPWSLLLPAAVVWGWKRRHVPQVRFAMAAFIGPWVMFELIVTKLPHYVLPTYPALAFLVADLLVRSARRRVRDVNNRGFYVATWIWATIVGAIGLGAPVALFLTEDDPTAKEAAGVLWIAVVAVVMGISTALRFRSGRPLAAARAMGGGMLLTVAIAYVLVLPDLRPLRLTRDIARLINDNGGYGQSGYMIEFKEPSLAFEQGGGLREQSDNDYLNKTPPEQWPEWIVLTRPLWDAARAEIRDRWEVVGSVAGLAYSDGGKRHDVLVLHKPAQPAATLPSPAMPTDVVQ